MNPMNPSGGTGTTTTTTMSNTTEVPAARTIPQETAAASKATAATKTTAKRKRTPKKGTAASKAKLPSKQQSSKKKKVNSKRASLALPPPSDPPPPVPMLPPGNHTIVPPGQHAFVPPGHHNLFPPGQHAFVPPGRQAFVPPAFVPPGHQAFVPLGHQALVPPGHQAFVPSGHHAFVPPDHHALAVPEAPALDEAAVPREDMPRNIEESQLLAELTQMGFPDRREILQGIRATVASAAPGSPVTAEAVMMFIITLREEQDEAKKMDQARLESESFRIQQEELRTEARKEQLDRLTTADDLRELFEASWILAIQPAASTTAPSPSSSTTISKTTTEAEKGISQSNEIHHKPGPAQSSTDGACCWRSLMDAGDDSRTHLLKWLSLEGRCQKWYGTLPRPYFEQRARELVARWKSGVAKSSGGNCGGWLQKECERLEVSLFSLEEQQGGVPRLFLRSADGIVENPIRID